MSPVLEGEFFIITATKTWELVLLVTVTAGSEGMILPVSVARIMPSSEMFLIHDLFAPPTGNTALMRVNCLGKYEDVLGFASRLM